MWLSLLLHLGLTLWNKNDSLRTSTFLVTVACTRQNKQNVWFVLRWKRYNYWQTGSLAVNYSQISQHDSGLKPFIYPNIPPSQDVTVKRLLCSVHMLKYYLSFMDNHTIDQALFNKCTGKAVFLKQWFRGASITWIIMETKSARPLLCGYLHHTLN